MKVICAGFWKTGTKSLAEALSIFGYKVYDYDYQIFELKHLWKKFFDGTVKDEDIRDAFENVDAIIDGPAIAFWEEIFKAVPDAKIILTIRDEDSWWKSYRGMMLSTPLLHKILYPFMILSPTGHCFVEYARRIFSFCIGLDSPILPIMSFEDNPRLHKFKFRQHNSHVQRSVPEKKLLVYHFGDGWERLCKFLGEPIPDVPYPHKNKDNAHFKSEGGPQHPAVKWMMLEVIVIISAIVALISYLIYYFM